MSLPPWRDTTIVAYLDEPPFAISGRAGERPSGCDMDVALHVLTGAGVGDIRYVRTTFHELIPGLLDHRADVRPAPCICAGQSQNLVAEADGNRTRL